MTKKMSSCLAEHADAIGAAESRLIEGRLAHQVAEMFNAFADPTRVRIINLIADEEKCVGELSLLLGISQPAVSSQLRLLRNVGVATVRRDGKHAFYTLADDHVRDLFKQGLEHILHG